MRVREFWVQIAIIVIGVIPIVLAIWMIFSTDIEATAQVQSPTPAAYHRH